MSKTTTKGSDQTITKTDLIEKLATKADISKASAKNVLSAFEDLVSESLQDGAKIRLNFGTLVVKERSERKGRNPATGAVITIPAAKTLTFKASSSVKKLLNAAKKKPAKK